MRVSEPIAEVGIGNDRDAESAYICGHSAWASRALKDIILQAPRSASLGADLSSPFCTAAAGINAWDARHIYPAHGDFPDTGKWICSCLIQQWRCNLPDATRHGVHPAAWICDEIIGRMKAFTSNPPATTNPKEVRDGLNETRTHHGCSHAG